MIKEGGNFNSFYRAQDVGFLQVSTVLIANRAQDGRPRGANIYRICY